MRGEAHIIDKGKSKVDKRQLKVDCINGAFGCKGRNTNTEYLRWGRDSSLNAFTACSDCEGYRMTTSNIMIAIRFADLVRI